MVPGGSSELQKWDEVYEVPPEKKGKVMGVSQR